MRALLFVAAFCLCVVLVQGLENVALIGCALSVGSSSICSPAGEVADVNYDASLAPSTSWQTVGAVTPNGYATVEKLLTGAVYEFRFCKGGSPSSASSIQFNTDATTAIASAAQCSNCNNQRPWVVYPTSLARGVGVINCDGLNDAAHTLELRLQPCTVCAVPPTTPINTGAASYTLTTGDISTLLVTVTQQGCQALTADSVSPNTFTCAKYEIAQNVTVTNTAVIGGKNYVSSCPSKVTIHDNIPPTLVCPVTTRAVPVKTCTTSISGTPAGNDLTVSMCSPAASDFPYGDYTDNCKPDPRFGLVVPVSSTPTQPMSIDQVTSFQVSYSQKIMDGTTYNFPTACPERMSALVVVYPRTGTHVLKGFTYDVAWASSIEYTNNAGVVKVETDFRIYLQQADPKDGQIPQIVNLQDLVTKTQKVGKPSLSTFNVNPATPLISKQYYLIVQGRNSGTNSVTNPILIFDN